MVDFDFDEFFDVIEPADSGPAHTVDFASALFEDSDAEPEVTNM